MPIYAKKKEYEVPPAGLHAAVCVDVVDLGIVQGNYGPQVKIKIVWQLAETNKKGYRFLVSQRYTPSLHKKSKLRPILESWRGRPFSPEEEKLFDIESVLRANCQLSITHNITDESVYANVSAVVPAARNAEKLVAENYTREIDRPDYVAPQHEAEIEPESQIEQVEDDDIPF